MKKVRKFFTWSNPFRSVIDFAHMDSPRMKDYPITSYHAGYMVVLPKRTHNKPNESIDKLDESIDKPDESIDKLDETIINPDTVIKQEDSNPDLTIPQGTVDSDVNSPLDESENDDISDDGSVSIDEVSLVSDHDGKEWDTSDDEDDWGDISDDDDEDDDNEDDEVTSNKQIIV